MLTRTYIRLFYSVTVNCDERCGQFQYTDLNFLTEEKIVKTDGVGASGDKFCTNGLAHVLLLLLRGQENKKCFSFVSALKFPDVS